MPTCRFCNFLYTLVHLLISIAIRAFSLVVLAFYSTHNILYTNCHDAILQVFFSIALVVYTICFYSIIGYCWCFIIYYQDLLFSIFNADFSICFACQIVYGHFSWANRSNSCKISNIVHNSKSKDSKIVFILKIFLISSGLTCVLELALFKKIKFC